MGEGERGRGGEWERGREGGEDLMSFHTALKYTIKMPQQLTDREQLNY